MRCSSLTVLLALVSAAWCCQYEQHPFNVSRDKNAPPYRKELLTVHERLVSIPSITGQEYEVANFLVSYLAEKGYNVETQPVAALENTPASEDRFNVLAWHGSKKARPGVVVTSHIDVVPPYIPYSIESGPITKETLIKGRGSIDAKGSVAAMIVALEQLLAAKMVNGDDVMLAFVVGEETEGDGMEAFNDSIQKADPPRKLKGAIFGEPTESKLVCGHMGTLSCEVRAKGKAGHSGYPSLGKSANQLMVRAMYQLQDTDLGSSKKYGNTTLNVGRFEGGVAANVIAESALVQTSVRVAIGPEKEGADIVQQRIQEILDEIDAEAFELDCGLGYGVVDCDCDIDGFETSIVNYGTDVPLLEGQHRRYLYGPGTILLAHGANESLTVGELEMAVEAYQQIILNALM